MSRLTDAPAAGLTASDSIQSAARAPRELSVRADWLLSYGQATVAQALRPERLSDGMAPPNVAIASTYRVHDLDPADPRPVDALGCDHRTMAVACVHAAASPASGKVTAWSHRIVAPAGERSGGNALVAAAHVIEGATRLPYALDPIRVEYVPHGGALPVGHWRSPDMSFNTFAVECAMDELAAAIGWDPILFRLNNLADARMSTVLTTLRTLAGLGTVPARGRGRGAAIAAAPDGYVGQAAEISVDPATGALTVHRVCTVVDFGGSPDAATIKARVEAAVAQGIAATLWVGPRFVDADGMPRDRATPGARPARLAEMPAIDVLVVTDGGPRGTVCGRRIPCVAPAIANAYARLKGPAARLRALPFFPRAPRVMGECGHA